MKEASARCQLKATQEVRPALRHLPENGPLSVLWDMGLQRDTISVRHALAKKRRLCSTSFAMNSK